MTYFRAVYPALSSARLRFTVLFGMGRRGSTALWSSGIRESTLGVASRTGQGQHVLEEVGFDDCALNAAQPFAEGSQL